MGERAPIRASLLAALLAGACGSGPSVVPGDDAGAPPADAGPAVGAAIPWLAEGAPPIAPPDLLPCADGWREVADVAGTITCAPWPETGRASCGPSEAHLPGTPGCVPIGSDCAADGWPAGLPSGVPIVHVDDGAAPGGDGTTRARAFRTIGEALAAAPEPSIVAIASGRYDERVALVGARTLWGACPRDTRLESTALRDDLATIEASGAGGVIRDLGVYSAEGPGIASSGATEIRDVVIDRARLFGVQAYFATGRVTLRRVRIAGTRAHETDRRQGGVALAAVAGAELHATEVSVEASVAVAVIAAGDGSVISLEDAAIAGTLPDSAGGAGVGAQAFGGGRVELRRAAIEGSPGIAVHAAQEGSALALEDVAIEGAGSYGVSVDDRARADVARTSIFHASGSALYASAAAHLDARDVVLRDVEPGDIDEGYGASVATRASAVIERARIDRARRTAILVGGAGTSATLADVTIADVRAGGTPAVAIGLQVQEAASATADRIAITRAESGITVAYFTPSLTIHDAVVREIRAGTVLPGRGLEIDDAVLDASRLLIEGASGVGVFSDASAIELADVLVRDGAASGFSAGLWAQSGGTARARGLTIRGARGVGVGAIGAEVELESAWIDGLEIFSCPRCPPAGFGLVSRDDGAIRASAFTVSSVATCGVVVGTAGAIDLVRGVLARAPVGACVQDATFDASRLRDEVRYEEVGVPLQATTHELPGLQPLPP